MSKVMQHFMALELSSKEVCCVLLSCLLTAGFTTTATAAWFKTMMFICWDDYIKWEVEVVDTLLVTRMVYC